MAHPIREQAATISLQRTFRCAIPGILLAVVCLLPFWNKAFTIDDAYFLMEARQALRTPLTPTATEICWDNAPMKQRIGSTGVVMAYILIPVILMDGKEWVGHLLILLTLCAAVAGTAGLALRCGMTDRQARWAGLIFASFPAVLGMAGTVMPDLPAAALAVVGMERLLAWKEEGRLHQALAAGASLGLAPAGRVHTILLWGIAVLILAGDHGSPPGRKILRWLPIAIAVLCFASFLWVTSDPGRVPSEAVFAGGPDAGLVGMEHIRSNLPEIGVLWMLATPLGIVWLLAAGRSGYEVLVAALVLGPALVYGAGVASGIASVLAAIGWGVIGWVIVWARRSGRGPLMWLALWLLLPLPVVLYSHLPCKYLVPCAPAAAILLVERLAALDARRRLLLSAASVCAGAVLGMAILQGDAAFAGLARQVVAQDVTPQIRAGRRVWYAGQWALTWYAEQAGANCFTLIPPTPQAGDLVVAGEIEGGSYVVRQYPLKLHLRRTISPAGLGMRLMNPGLHVGFYSNFFGYLPWRLARAAPVNTYYIWEVE